jgi:hypothetical protein
VFALITYTKEMRSTTRKIVGVGGGAMQALDLLVTNALKDRNMAKRV